MLSSYLFSNILKDKTASLCRMFNRQFKVFITQPIPKEAEEIMKNQGIELKINSTTPLSREVLLESVKDCDALFCTLNEKIDTLVLNNAGPNLKVVATCSVGYDHIDLKECALRNVKVGYTPGVLTDATAEFTIGLLLNTTRRISESVDAARNGEWADWKITWMCGKGISGSTVGIFGLGRIGFAVAQRLKSFSPKRIIYHNRTKNDAAEKNNFVYASLDEFLTESDFIICTCSTSEMTENYFNKKVFEKMKRDAIFINVSRGNVVNQNDLHYALKNQIIAAAGLDVTTPEPLPIDHDLFKLKNCFITPHVCSAETNTRIKMSVITAHNIVNGLNNRSLLHQV